MMADTMLCRLAPPALVALSIAAVLGGGMVESRNWFAALNVSGIAIVILAAVLALVLGPVRRAPGLVFPAFGVALSAAAGVTSIGIYRELVDAFGADDLGGLFWMAGTAALLALTIALAVIPVRAAPPSRR
ncbi:hypothetical protein [Sediminivirga luteola]|uniref:hypothetical protein n=1 Tax=Sediminivirga luteola TaxID=1774748 RepID=UPI001F5978A0|nr:hypothetical protein [Sediminivirga luteola]MCI2266673.1 hypothetical protein [Sediminivirga luteola]